MTKSLRRIYAPHPTTSTTTTFARQNSCWMPSKSVARPGLNLRARIVYKIGPELARLNTWCQDVSGQNSLSLEILFCSFASDPMSQRLLFLRPSQIGSKQKDTWKHVWLFRQFSYPAKYIWGYNLYTGKMKKTRIKMYPHFVLCI